MLRRRFMMATTMQTAEGGSDLSTLEPELVLVDGERGGYYTGTSLTFGKMRMLFPKATTRDLTEAEKKKYIKDERQPCRAQ